MENMLILVPIAGFIYCIIRKRPIGQYLVWTGVLILSIASVAFRSPGSGMASGICGLVAIGLFVFVSWDPFKWFYQARLDMEKKYPEYYKRRKITPDPVPPAPRTVTRSEKARFDINFTHQAIRSAQAKKEEAEKKIQDLEKKRDLMSKEEYESAYRELQSELDYAKHLIEYNEKILSQQREEYDDVL